MMTNRVEVRVSKLSTVMMALLALVFIPLGLVSLIQGVGRGFAAVPVATGLMMLLMFALVVWLVRRAHRRSVRYFSEEGLERHDGTSCSWADLESVTNQERIISHHTGRKARWRTEIRFRNGVTVWLIPRRIANYQEVDALVQTLPCPHIEKIV